MFGLDSNWFQRDCSTTRLRCCVRSINGKWIWNTPGSKISKGMRFIAAPTLFLLSLPSAVRRRRRSRSRAIHPAENGSGCCVRPIDACRQDRRLGTVDGFGRLDTAELSDFPSTAPAHVVLVPSRHDAYRDPVEALTKRCLEIKSCAEKIGAAQTTLWVIFFGAVRSGSATVRPIEAGAWAFTRSLANEYPKIDVRRIDFAPHVTPDAAAEAIRKIILSGTEETDIHADGAAFRAIRVEPLKRAIDAQPGQMVEAARLNGVCPPVSGWRGSPCPASGPTARKWRSWSRRPVSISAI